MSGLDVCLSLACGLAALALVACSGARASPSFTSALDAMADAAPPEPDTGALLYGDGGAGTVPDAAFGACAASVEEARPLLLDLAFLLDTSGSMNDLAGPGQSKWGALVQALTAFVRDPASSGLGVAVQYFPVPPAGVPVTCASNADCGDAGPCLVGQCDDITALPCATPDDCFFGGACVPTATCTGDPSVVCGTLGGACGADGNGFDLGACAPAPFSYCASSDSCAASDYASPAVAMGRLPDVADAVVASLGAQQPHGGTPTPAALQGTLAAVASYALAHPAHRVATVLATDGVPDEAASLRGPFCAGVDPGPSNDALVRLAANAAAARPPILTFAVGVFTPDQVDAGVASLAPIAAAGGTDQPFIVETGAALDGGGTASQLVEALNRIRAASLPCRFSIPAPEAGALDFGKVNVRVSSGVQNVDPPYVARATACSSADGWYYDVDPASGGVPAAIVACPATCAWLGANPTARVDILLGCETVVR
jgi:hypothetical protein